MTAGISALGFFSSPFVATTTQFTSAGSHTITIPQGASVITLEIFGPGGGGGGSSTTVVGQGGGSGGRCVSIVNVSAHVGQTFTMVVGAAPVPSGVPGNFGQQGTNSTVTVGTFSGSFTTMTAVAAFGGSASLGGGGGGGAASGGNSVNTTGNSSTAQPGATGLTGTYINGLNGGTGANHPGSTSQPDTAGSVGQGAVHFS